MRLTELQQQAIRARMSLIVGADYYDRLFLGTEFSEVEKGILYCFSKSGLASEIEGRFALHVSIIASQIVRVPVEFVLGMPIELRGSLLPRMRARILVAPLHGRSFDG